MISAARAAAAAGTAARTSPRSCSASLWHRVRLRNQGATVRRGPRVRLEEQSRSGGFVNGRRLGGPRRKDPVRAVERERPGVVLAQSPDTNAEARQAGAELVDQGTHE